MQDSNLRCVTAADTRRLGMGRDNVDHLLVDAAVAQQGEASYWPGRAADGPMSDHNGAAVRLVV
jgi:hypothetical protein